MYKSIILHGYESCSLILREEYTLRMFENSVLSTVFLHEERGWWKLYN
jgi:hypothetical protein